MAKRPSIGKCVHCLADSVERNWDHVFPKSWYPDTTPPNTSKWKIPSCVPCNSKYGEIEAEFLVLVALCLDPDDDASRSIVRKALRAINPKFSQDATDESFRARLAEIVRQRVVIGPDIPHEGIYPTLGEKWGRPHEGRTGVLIPEASFRLITEKIVRGIYFIEGQKFIEPPYCINFFALDDEGAKPARDILDSAGSTFAREPGIVVRRVVAEEDDMFAIFEIEFWKQFKTHASVSYNDLSD